MICGVLGCTNRTSDKQKGISFYRFPQDEIIKQKWVEILSRDGWSPNPSIKVCSAHFEHTEISKNSKKSLIETTIPTILPPLNEENSFKPSSKIVSTMVDVEMEEVSIKDTFLNLQNQLPAKASKNESIKSKFSVMCQLAADMNSIKSKINIHLKTGRRKNCEMRANIEKLKRFLIEIKEENTTNNPVLFSLFENALKEPPDAAIDYQLEDNYWTGTSIEGEQLTQQSESTLEVKIKDTFVLHLTNELKQLHSEDFTLIKRDIQNILEANNKLNCNEL